MCFPSYKKFHRFPTLIEISALICESPKCATFSTTLGNHKFLGKFMCLRSFPNATSGVSGDHIVLANRQYLIGLNLLPSRDQASRSDWNGEAWKLGDCERKKNLFVYQLLTSPVQLIFLVHFYIWDHLGVRNFQASFTEEYEKFTCLIFLLGHYVLISVSLYTLLNL